MNLFTIDRDKIGSLLFNFNLSLCYYYNGDADGNLFVV